VVGALASRASAGAVSSAACLAAVSSALSEIAWRGTARVDADGVERIASARAPQLPPKNLVLGFGDDVSLDLIYKNLYLLLITEQWASS